MTTARKLPIATAPQTGRIILVMANDAEPCTAFWCKHGGGFWSSNQGDCDEIDFTPTHWALLPEFD